jgi:ParB family transcriptional regulator, chromosome partitioning protein
VAGLGKGLGKGFDVLIPTEFDTSLLVDSSERIQKLLVTDIIPNPDQPRRHFDEQGIAELAASIRRHGVLQPLIVSPTSDGKYRIVAGERRWRAAQVAGLTDVPAIVRERKELEELEIALIENVQRVDLSPLEQAISIERLHQQFNLSYKEIAERLAKAETTVSNLVRLLQLPEDARDALQNGKISEGHARAVLALKAQPEKQQELLASILSLGWSVRQAEQFVVSSRAGAVTKAAVKQRMATETPETKNLGERLGVPVSIKRTAKGGRVEIGFTSDEELKALLDRLAQVN